MTNYIRFSLIAASSLAALTIGLAASAAADPSGYGPDQDTITGPAIAYPNTTQTPYGTYQNAHKGR